MNQVETNPSRRHRVRIGQLWMDAVGFDEALLRIEQLVTERRGGFVFTPNVDHFVQAERNEAFRRAYAEASLSLVDGQPVLWAARLLGTPLPEKISGSDLIPALVERAARAGHRVYLLGGLPGVAEEATALFRSRGVNVVGAASPKVGLSPHPDEPAWVEAISATQPDLVLAALGTPKQELWIHRNYRTLAPAVCLGVGATLDFMVGRVARAPRWISQAGLEWLFRLLRDPRRLARRYLIDDPRFLAVLVRTWRMRKQERLRLSS